MGKQQGVNSDLTMLEPQPSADEQAFNELVKNPPKDSVAISGPTTPKQAQNYVKGLQQDYLQSASMQEGRVDLGLDENRSMFEDINSVRSRNQSEGIKGLKAVGGGLLKGALITAEELGYVGDLEGIWQRFNGDPEGMSGNWWSTLMQDTQEAIGESNAFKIYEDAPDENSLTSQIFKWSSLEGAISSAVGFGLTGLGAAKLVSTLGSLGKFQQLAKMTDVAMGNLKGGAALAEATAAGGGMAGASGAFVGPLATSAMSNYFMGQMMGTDTYNQILEGLEPMIESGEIDRFEAQKIASKEAQDVVTLNMALTATAYIKFGSIFKRQGKIKGLVENPSALNQIKNLIKAGSPTAFTENVYQEMIQMEQIYDTDKALGRESDMSDDYWSRMTNLALSNRALHAGALGVVGGPIQFALIQRPFMGKQVKSQKELFTKQQASRAYQKSLIDTYYKTFGEFDKMSKEALIKGDPKDARFIEDVHTITELAKSIENGTMSILKKDIQDIMKYSPEQATELGYDENFQEAGQAFLDDIGRAEGYLMNYGALVNKAEVVQNLLMHDRTLKEGKTMIADRTAAISKVTTDIKEVVGVDAMFNEKGKFEIVRDPNRFEGMPVSQKAVLLKQESIANQKLDDYLASNRDFKSVAQLTKGINKYAKFAKELNDKHEFMISPEGQIKYNQEQTEATTNFENDVKGEVNKQAKEDALTETQKQAKDFDTFSKIRKEAPQLTEQELADQAKAWDTEVGDNRVRTLDSTFTSRDDLGEVQNYTPGELKRSWDGRYFKVVSQNKAGTEKGKVKYQEKPILIQTDENGYVIKGSKPFILEEHNFLREESLLPFIKRDGTIANNYPKDRHWGVYVSSDSLLKPNDVEYQLSLVERAQRAEVAGVNIPATLLQKGDYAWLEKYNHQLLNLPFKEPYDVVYKVDNQGEHEIYVDVYKREEGKEDVLLTRLNNSANLNYQDLINYITLNKGEVTGKAIGHYSNRYNMVKHYDQNGDVIYKDIKEIKNMHPEYLINGQIILAQTKGKNAYPTVDVARSEDGTVYSDGYINYQGKTLTIPYDSMSVGDTYALILSPGGEIVPIALSADKLIDMPSQLDEGNSFTDDVVAVWQDAVKDWLKDELKTEEKEDADLWKLIKNDKDVEIRKQNEVFAERKAKRLWDKIKEQHETEDKENNQNAAFQSTIYKHIRPNWNKYALLSEKGAEDEVYETRKVNRKVKKVVRANYFNPTVAVSKTTGEFTPAIRVRNPQNHTLEITYNLIDDTEKFYEIIGDQRKRASINVLADQSMSDKEGAALMQDFINKEGLKIDIDTVTPFMGSSGTFIVDGADFKTSSIDSADLKRTKLEKQFGKVIEKLETYADTSNEDLIEDFAETIADRLEGDSEWMQDTNASTEVEEVQGRFKDLIYALRINQDKAVIAKLDEIFKEVPPELETRYNELVKSTVEKGYKENSESIAKGILALEFAMNEVNQGNMTLKTKHRLTSTTDPTGKLTQPEGLIFQFGTKVYHAEVGEATFKTELKTGRYKITTKNGKEIVVDPGDTFLISGDRAELYRTIKEIGKLDPEDTKSLKTLTSRKNRLDAKIFKNITKDIKGTEDRTEDTMDNILEDQFTAMGAQGAILKQVKGFGSTTRTKEIVNALQGFDAIKAIVESEENFEVILSDEDQMTINETFSKVIPYTQTDLTALIGLAEIQIQNKVDVTQAKKAVAIFNTMKNLLSTVETFQPQEEPINIESQLYNSKTGNTTKSSLQYLGIGKGQFAITGGDISLQMDRIMNSIQKAIVAESTLKQTMFMASPSPKAAVTSTATKKVVKDDKSDNDAAKKGKAKKINIKGEKEEAFAFSSDAQARMLQEQFKDVPSKVIKIVESGNYNIITFKELVENLEAFKRSKQDVKPLWDDFIDQSEVPFKRGDDVSNTQEQFDAEVAQVKAMLPAVPIEVVANVVGMVNKYGLKSIGSFDTGVLYIVNRAKEGAVFHEAFHAVADLYLTADEKIAIAKENGQDVWNQQLEEKLAEKFEKYVNNKPQSLGQRILNFFKGLMFWRNGTRSKDVTEKIFNKIVTKGYATSKSLSWRDRVSPIFDSIEDFKSNLSEENSVLLQSLLNSNKIEIVC